jgi:transposase, IS30 family
MGYSKEALLTLVERKTRMMIVRKIPDKTQESVLRAMRSIEASMGSKVFRAIFKSITADSGSEFLDVENMEKSAFSKKLRVTLYYAHPYSSYERGSNENGNRMIRRFIAKGSNIADFTRSFITWVQNWINHYLRKILNYKSAMELICLEAVQCVGFIPCGI